MHKQIFINLAVADLPKARAFFNALGFSFNPTFSNDQGACLILGENLFAMLLVKPFFQTFTSRPSSTRESRSKRSRACRARAVPKSMKSSPRPSVRAARRRGRFKILG